ncbi:MAG: hypothetical protein M9890_10210 [Thermomicrobiales bacterium]|nr:hypothetical protein [Thermomicrobiales bacterium]
MDNDDLPVGRVLSRREVLALFGATGVVMLAGCSTSADDPTATSAPATLSPTPTITPEAATTPTSTATAAETDSATATTEASDDAEPTESSEATPVLLACVVSPELTEGPYFVDERLLRSDIRTDPSTDTAVEGVQLDLTVRVAQVGSDGCVPLANAAVDIWQCDALGVYSDVQDPGFDTAGTMFLRGYQVTGDDGAVRFTTIYPGWYQGRAVHIHFKVRGDSPGGGSYEFTSQWFFDDALSDIVHTKEPYAQKGQRTLMNDGDSIFRDGGNQLVLDVTQTDTGYAATYDIGVQLD